MPIDNSESNKEESKLDEENIVDEEHLQALSVQVLSGASPLGFLVEGANGANCMSINGFYIRTNEMKHEGTKPVYKKQLLETVTWKGEDVISDIFSKSEPEGKSLSKSQTTLV